MPTEREPTALYDQEGIKITDWPAEENGHFLYVDGDLEHGYALMRGALEDLGRRTSLRSLTDSLDQINPLILHTAKQANISVDQIRLAFNQARIKELEEQSSYFFRKVGDLETELGALIEEQEQDS